MTKTAQNENKAISRQVRKFRKFNLTAEMKYYIIQKIVGIVILILGIVAGVWIESVAPLFFGCGVGTVLIFSKEKILMVGDVYWDENPIKSDKED